MIDGITYDTSIHVMIGLDVVWQIEFKRQVSAVSSNEMEILNELIHIKEKGEQPTAEFFEAMLDDILIHLEK